MQITVWRSQRSKYSNNCGARPSIISSSSWLFYRNYKRRLSWRWAKTLNYAVIVKSISLLFPVTVEHVAPMPSIDTGNIEISRQRNLALPCKTVMLLTNVSLHSTCKLDTELRKDTSEFRSKDVLVHQEQCTHWCGHKILISRKQNSVETYMYNIIAINKDGSK